MAATPEAVKAAFTKEGDLFKEKGVPFLDTFVNLSKPDVFERQMYEEFKDILGLSPEENTRAMQEGYRALDYFNNVTMRGAAREVLEELEREDRLGVVLLGRPVSQRPRREPRNPGRVPEARLPGLHAGLPAHRRRHDLAAVRRRKWNRARFRIPCPSTTCGRTPTARTPAARCGPRSMSARHPNLVALELSSFKCGHDAPIYSVVEEIVEHSGTPYFCFKDIDENKPTGSIRIRVETIGYFLKRYREDMVRNKNKVKTIEEQMAEFEARLRRQMLREKLETNQLVQNRSIPAPCRKFTSASARWQRPKPAPQYETVSGDSVAQASRPVPIALTD